MVDIIEFPDRNPKLENAKKYIPVKVDGKVMNLKIVKNKLCGYSVYIVELGKPKINILLVAGGVPGSWTVRDVLKSSNNIAGRPKISLK